MATTQRTTTRRTNPTWARIGTAREREEYIPVGSTTGSNLTLTGAETRFQNFPDLVYIPELNLVGTEQDLIQAITSLVNQTTGQPFTVDEAQDYIASGYNSENISIPAAEGGRAEEFEAEYERVSQARSGRTTAAPAFTLSDLPYLVENLASSQETTTRARQQGAGQTSPGRRGARLTLAQRLENLPADNVLDVTSMTAQGTGVKKQGLPGPQSGRIGVNIVEIPIVSANPETYARAIRELGYENAEDIINAYNQIYAQRNQAATQAAQRTQPAARGATGRGRGRGGARGGTTRQAPRVPVQTPVRQVSPRQVSPRQGLPQQTFPTQPTAQNINTAAPSLRNIINAGRVLPSMPNLANIRQGTMAPLNIPRANNPVIGSNE